MKAQINEMATISEMYGRIAEQMFLKIRVRRKAAGMVMPVRPERELRKAARSFSRASQILKRMIEKDFHNVEPDKTDSNGTENV